MSWADDIRCLYCDGRLPLYRKITNGQFCSGAHRKAYWKEHERLAVERLHQTHDELLAYRPPGAVERILGASDGDEETSPLFPVLDGAGVGAEAVAGQGPTAVSISTNALPDGRSALDRARPDGRASSDHARPHERASDGRALLPSDPAEPAIAGLLRPALFALPRWLPDSLAAVDLTPFESSNILRRPVIVWTRRESVMTAAPAVPMAMVFVNAPASEAGISNANTIVATPNAASASAIYPNVDAAHPRITLTLDAVPEQVRAGGDELLSSEVAQNSKDQGDVEQRHVEQRHVEQISQQIPAPRVPEMAGLLALGVAQVREIASTPILATKPEASAAPIVPRTQLPLNIPRIEASLVRAGLMHVGLPHAGLRELPVSRVSPVQSASLEDGLRAIDLRAGLEAPLFPPPASPGGLNLPRLSLAAGSRYQMETQSAAAMLAPPQGEGFAPISAIPPRIALPERSVKAMATSATGSIHLPVYVANDVSNDVSNDVAKEVPTAVSAEALSPVREVAGIRVTPARRSDARHQTKGRSKQETALETNPETAPGVAHGLTPGVNQAITAAENPAGLLQALSPEFEPSPSGLLPLACNAQPSEPASDIRPAPAALSLPQPLTRQPVCPDSNLEPLDSKPASDGMGGSKPGKSLHNTQYALHWTHAIDFWNRAPRDLKMLVFAIPLLLGLALHPALPKVRVAAPAAANGIERNVERAFNDQWVNVKQTMFDRAAVALDEDFRSGLDDWASRDDATAAWSFDATGFVRPGPLALYRPSMGLSDYQMQFLGVIDKQALSWVVRAADYDNFYVVKLQVLKSGPLPTIGVVRYAVVNGKADSRVDTIAPIDARSDMLYRVRLDVRGDDFALSVQGQMVDSWSEPRLRRGGIGFFSARGEESRLRWVQVTHQYDMLGRLCAYLAPYNVPLASGSWQP